MLIHEFHPKPTNFFPLKIAASQTGTDGDVITEEGSTHKAADPFDIGGGQVNPKKAMDPGLLYEIRSHEYIQFLCSMSYSIGSISRVTKYKTSRSCKKERNPGLNLNLPSITVPNLKKTVKVTRTVTNVGDETAVYKAIVKAPYGIKIRIEPEILSFNASTHILSFNVILVTTQKLHGDYKFGGLTWTDGKHFVRSPITVRTIKFESYADV